MYPTSGNLFARAKRSRVHDIDMRVTLSDNRSFTLDDFPTLVDGGVNVQEGAARRTCSMTWGLVDRNRVLDLVLQDSGARFEPKLYGIPLGHFYIKDTFIDEPGDHANLRVSLDDRSMLIAERRTITPMSFFGRPFEVVVAMMDYVGVPVKLRMDVGLAGSGWVPSLYTYDVDTDLWGAAQEVLKPVGLQLYFDIYGNLILEPIPKYATISAVDITDYVLGKQTTLGKQMTNHLVMMVENDNQIPFRVDVYDTNPSASSAVGPRGDLPMLVRARGLPDKIAAYDAAYRIFGTMKGRQQTDVFSIFQLPIWELHDVFEVSERLYVVKQISYSLVYSRPTYVTSRLGPTNA